MKTVSQTEAIQLLLQGGVGVMPTDTVYGIVACASNQEAVGRLYKIKHREHKPGTIIAASIEQLVTLGIKKRYLSAVEQFWPNPLSVIIPTGRELEYLHQGLDSLAVRIPKEQSIHEFLLESGPLLTSSANEPGQPTAANLGDAYAYFKDIVDFYVDGGDLSDKPASTLIRVVDDAVEVLRQGAVDISETGRISQTA